MNFASDNAGPVHPRVIEALIDANLGHAMPYGADPLTARARDLIRTAFEAPAAEVLLVPTGTGANGLALGAMVPRWGRVFCAQMAHIQVDEMGALPFHSGGADCALVPAQHGRITPEALEARIRAETPERRAAVSITQATEDGTLYAPDQIAALAAVARAHGMGLHMDGARLANAVAALGVRPAQVTWRAGVDVLSLGGTKNGLMGVEAVVIFDPARAAPDVMALLRQRAGMTFSKHRFLAAQMVAAFTQDLWLDMGRAANSAAARLAAGLMTLPQVALVHPVEANILFARLPRGMHRYLQDAGVAYYMMDHAPLHEGPADQPLTCRLVCDWSCDADRVDCLLDLCRAYMPG